MTTVRDGHQAAAERRLREAMIAVAAEEGYSGASVSRVLERAGLSRATFYQYFCSREDCFLAAYRSIAAYLLAELGARPGFDSRGPRPEALVSGLLEAAAAYPDHALVLLLESRAGPSAVRDEHGRLVAALDTYAVSRGRVSSVPLPGAALLGALGGIVSNRLLEADSASLPLLAGPFLAWLEAYRVPARHARDFPGWERLGGRLEPFPEAPPPRQPELLPRGSTALSAEVAETALRGRILAAMARLAAQRGYAAVSIAEIAAAARVSRRAFYASFSSKESAFLAAQAESLRSAIASASAAFCLAPSWPEAVWSSTEATLAFMAANPDLVALGVGEVYAAGREAVRRSEQSQGAFRIFLEPAFAVYPAVAGVGCREFISQAVASAVHGLMRRQLVRGRVDAMRSMLPQAVFVILAPFLGAGEALEFITAKVAAARSAPRTPPLPVPAPGD